MQLMAHSTAYYLRLAQAPWTKLDFLAQSLTSLRLMLFALFAVLSDLNPESLWSIQEAHTNLCFIADDEAELS